MAASRGLPVLGWCLLAAVVVWAAFHGQGPPHRADGIRGSLDILMTRPWRPSGRAAPRLRLLMQSATAAALPGGAAAAAGAEGQPAGDDGPCPGPLVPGVELRVYRGCLLSGLPPRLDRPGAAMLGVTPAEVQLANNLPSVFLANASAPPIAVQPGARKAGAHGARMGWRGPRAAEPAGQRAAGAPAAPAPRAAPARGRARGPAPPRPRRSPARRANPHPRAPPPRRAP